MLCDLIEHEMADGNRIVYSNDAFIAVTPFASKMPFEMWILPMAHSRSFGQLDQGSALLLADALRAIANGLRRGWGDPPSTWWCIRRRLRMALPPAPAITGGST